MLSFRSQFLAFVAVWVIGTYTYARTTKYPVLTAVFLTPTLAVTIVLIFASLWQVVYYRYIHPLSELPGPFWASVTRLWLARVNIKGREHTELFELHKIYGPVVRITPTLLSISETSMIPQIYHREADKTEHYSALVKGGPESFFNMTDHRAYVKARKAISKPFTPSGVAAFAPLIDTHIGDLLKHLSTLSSRSKAFDFAPLCTYLAYDVLTDLTFGSPLGFIRTLSDVGGLITSLHAGWLIFGLFSRLHPLKTFLAGTTAVRKIFTAKPRGKTAFSALMVTRDKLIDERLETMQQGKKDVPRQDVLQGLLEAVQRGELSMKNARQEVLALLVAGADTVGTALQTVVLDLLQHPGAMARCTAEIIAAHEAGKISTPPSVQEVPEHCHFFEACVKETLRLHPAAPGIFPRLVGSDGVWLDGRFVPPGTEVAANIWVVHRDRELFGEDAEEWKPERWLESSEERMREINRLSMNWGVDRPCLGKEVALMEIYKAAAELIRRFEWELVQDEEKRKPRFVVKAGVGWWEDIWVRLRERD